MTKGRGKSAIKRIEANHPVRRSLRLIKTRRARVDETEQRREVGDAWKETK